MQDLQGGPTSLPELHPFSRESAQIETSISVPVDPAQQILAIGEAVERMARLVQQNIALGDQRNDKMAKLLQAITEESSELFTQMRDTMELVQQVIAQIDLQVSRLGQVTAALVVLDTNFREMVALWQAEHGMQTPQ